MSDLYQPEQQALKQADAAKAVEQQALEKRISQAELAKTEVQPAADDLNAQAQKAEMFHTDFRGKDGSEGIAHKASPENANLNDRNGAQHQIDVANTLGTENVKSFETVYEAGQDKGRVDIVTNDNIAVECKYSSDPLRPSDINYAAAQAVRRLDSGQFKGVAVVYNDGTLNDDMENYSNLYNREYPNLHFCERSELNSVLSKMKQGA